MWTAVFFGPEILSLPNDGDICYDIPYKHRGSEIRMSVIRFLLEYTVNHVFGGNKSQCARELGMTYNYFSKIYRRTSEGSYSIRLVEDLLLLFMRMDISLDDCLREYTQSQRGKRIEDMESSCVKAYERIQGSISHMQSEAQDVTDLMRAATRMSDHLRKVFCSDIPECTHDCTGDCPIVEFGVYIMEIKKQIGLHVNESTFKHLQEEKMEIKTDPKTEINADALA